MTRVRKAIGAGLFAAMSWAAGQWVQDTPSNTGDWTAFIVGALGAGVIAGVLTYNLKNQNRDGSAAPGSDPTPPETFTLRH